jgi:hypothetical protein
LRRGKKQKLGFDAEKYIEEQSKYILERINQGNSERLTWNSAESWYMTSMP